MPYDLTDAEFHALVESAIGRLPAEYRQTIADEVPVRVESRPSRRLLREMGMAEDELLLGLFEGPNREELAAQLVGAGGGEGIVPARITLFKQDLEDACSSRDEMAEEVRVTLFHELGHYFGLDEDDLDHLGFA